MQFIDSQSKQFTYNEVRNCLSNFMNYSWMKANVRPTRFFWPKLSQVRILFKKFIEKLNQTEFLIVFIDECSFNPTTISRYSWMKRGEPADKLIRDTTNRYNSIAAQWDKFVHFDLKTETSNEESI